MVRCKKNTHTRKRVSIFIWRKLLRETVVCQRRPTPLARTYSDTHPRSQTVFAKSPILTSNENVHPGVGRWACVRWCKVIRLYVSTHKNSHTTRRTLITLAPRPGRAEKFIWELSAEYFFGLEYIYLAPVRKGFRRSALGRGQNGPRGDLSLFGA